LYINCCIINIFFILVEHSIFIYFYH
jgi:hypothetical protein